MVEMAGTGKEGEGERPVSGDAQTERAVCRHHEETWIHALLSGFQSLQYERLTFTTMNGHRSNRFYCIVRRP